jgi:hypothetical protein
MKNWVLLFLVFLVYSCGFFDDGSGKKKKNHGLSTLLFIDKTSSVNYEDTFVKNKYAEALRKIIEENIDGSGDVLEVYYIHENTTKARCLSLKSRTEDLGEEGLNETDLEAAKTSYDLDIKKEREKMYVLCLKKMLEPNDTGSNKETHIAEAVSVIADKINQGEDVKAYFFSDMVESNAAGRDFHKAAPKTKEEAGTWATEDAKLKSEFNLSGSEVRWLLPFAPNTDSKRNNPLVGQYWIKFFESLNANQVSEL